MEGVWAYHTINANQFQVIVPSDCHWIFEPYAKETLKDDLKQCNYVSIYTDSSNHESVKLFSVLVRYFLPKLGVRVKVLDISSEPGKTSLIISDLVTSVACEFDLDKKIIAFCANNAKVNFGRITRGKNNVYHRLRVLYPQLLGIGITAHIAHSELKNAGEAIHSTSNGDILTFYLYTVRTDALKAFCDEADVEYMRLLGYAKTRFLALGSAIKRILQLFDGLKIYFVALPKGEKILKSRYTACFSCKKSRSLYLHEFLDETIEATEDICMGNVDEDSKMGVFQRSDVKIGWAQLVRRKRKSSEIARSIWICGKLLLR